MKELLTQQRVMIGSIERTLENFQKIGKANFTYGIVRNRLQSLKEAFARCEQQHGRILAASTTEFIETDNYFTEDQFCVCETMYLAASDYMAEWQSLLEPTMPSCLESSPISHRHHSIAPQSTFQLPRRTLPKLINDGLKKTEEDNMCDKFLAILGEVIGTAILVFLGCTAGLGSMKPYEGTGPSVIQISFAFGLAVMIAIQCVGHISGAHLNPAITIAAVILGNKTLIMAGFYIIAQCLGALIGFGLLKLVTPANLMHNGAGDPSVPFCMTDINKEITVGHGIAAEALATGVLAFFACGSWDSRNAKNSDSMALKFGLCVTVLCLAFIPHTGCSLNPARTFGPAVWNGHWTYHWVYWLGPIGGAVIAALIYRSLFSPKTKDPDDNIKDMGTFNGIET
ncbi:aquaporin AQPAe.a-like isoform X1 [Temnothorax longispinosus]|uniref:aquaporin AQPAe.a-like isoform X1 n=1 Tax=Temnothorax longispinosus TaxID=300112 RepID=UPI003A997E84